MGKPPLHRLDFRPRSERPFVFVSMVMTADGRAVVDGGSAGIGGPADTELLASLRELPDALLVGTRTMRAENYRRPVRAAERIARRVAAGRTPSPLVVCVSRSGDVPWEVPLFADADASVLVLGPASVPDGVAAAVEVAPAAGLDAVLRSLRERGVGVVMGEGGPAMNGALLAAGLVDELFVTVAPSLAGGPGPGIVTGNVLVDMRLEWAIPADSGELFLRYRICR